MNATGTKSPTANGESLRSRRGLQERSLIAREQRVAVGLGLGHQLGADPAAGPAAIVDDDLLAERSGEMLREQASRDVGRCSRRERHHHADDLIGILRWRRLALCFSWRRRQ